MIDLGFDKGITIHHLLTHTSGMPEYYDEETCFDFSDIFKDTPMYLLKEPSDFIPMILKQKFTDYITDNIIIPCNLKSTGYLALNNLPENCATGYYMDGDKLVSNIYTQFQF